MKMKLIGIIVLVAIIGFGFAACGGDDDGNGGGNSHTHDWNTTSETISEGVKAITCKADDCNGKKDYTFDYAIGENGLGGGKIIYVADGQEGRSLGFTVTGTGSFTAYYLEAATSNHTALIAWCSCNLSSMCDVTGTSTAIGTGKANTAAILAHTAHSSVTTSNCAAKAANITISGKNDWFLPSKDELNEMNKAKSHLGISSGVFWSSSQSNNNNAWYYSFGFSAHYTDKKNVNDKYVRAVRAF